MPYIDKTKKKTNAPNQTKNNLKIPPTSTKSFLNNENIALNQDSQNKNIPTTHTLLAQPSTPIANDKKNSIYLQENVANEAPKSATKNIGTKRLDTKRAVGKVRSVPNKIEKPQPNIAALFNPFAQIAADLISNNDMAGRHPAFNTQFNNPQRNNVASNSGNYNREIKSNDEFRKTFRTEHSISHHTEESHCETTNRSIEKALNTTQGNNYNLHDPKRSIHQYFIDEYSKKYKEELDPKLNDKFKNNAESLIKSGYKTVAKVNELFNEMYTHDIWVTVGKEVAKKTHSEVTTFAEMYDPDIFVAGEDDTKMKVADLIAGVVVSVDLCSSLIPAFTNANVYNTLEKAKELNTTELHILPVNALIAFKTASITNTQQFSRLLFDAFTNLQTNSIARKSLAGKKNNVIDSFAPILFSAGGFIQSWYKENCLSSGYALLLGATEPEEFNKILKRVRTERKLNYEAVFKELGLSFSRKIYTSAVQLIIIGYSIHLVLQTKDGMNSDSIKSYHDEHNVALANRKPPLGRALLGSSNAEVATTLAAGIGVLGVYAANNALTKIIDAAQKITEYFKDKMINLFSD